MRKTILFPALVALVVTLSTLGLYTLWQEGQGRTIQIEHVNANPAQQAIYSVGDDGELIPLDFTQVAEDVMAAVVHIRSSQAVSPGREQGPSFPFDDLFPGTPWEEFFGPQQPFRQTPPDQRPRLRMGQGSGVIISPDGHIVTNNHVIQDADDLEVTLYDNRSFKAQVIGTDPSTDLALIKIEADDLPTLPIQDSDEVKVGEWVLAVGNPFNLTSTVTAGIVSAKARSINILREQFAVESFIQTDAAINPGNSGGALVNLAGHLIGINTAIASPTGAYSGYGFAVPTNIVSKVVEDLLTYGTVQRGVLGVMIRTVDGSLQRAKELEVTTGAYVDSLLEHSAAAAAGVQAGDVIIAVDDHTIQNSPQLQEMIARYRPGDEVEVTINRKGQEKTFSVILNNRAGNTELVKKEQPDLFNALGLEVETIDPETARRLQIEGGVRVTRLLPGKLRRQTGIRTGFIITHVDEEPVLSTDQLWEKLSRKSGGVLLEGVYEDLPGKHYYGFGLEN